MYWNRIVNPCLIMLTIVLLFYGCSRDSCVYEVGDEIEVTAYEGGLVAFFNVNIEECESDVVLTIVGSPISVKPGDVIQLEVVKVKSEFSYNVVVID